MANSPTKQTCISGSSGGFELDSVVLNGSQHKCVDYNVFGGIGWKSSNVSLAGRLMFNRMERNKLFYTRYVSTFESLDNLESIVEFIRKKLACGETKVEKINDGTIVLLTELTPVIFCKRREKAFSVTYLPSDTNATTNAKFELFLKIRDIFYTAPKSVSYHVDKLLFKTYGNEYDDKKNVAFTESIRHLIPPIVTIVADKRGKQTPILCLTENALVPLEDSGADRAVTGAWGGRRWLDRAEWFAADGEPDMFYRYSVMQMKKYILKHIKTCGANTVFESSMLSEEIKRVWCFSNDRTDEKTTTKFTLMKKYFAKTLISCCKLGVLRRMNSSTFEVLDISKIPVNKNGFIDLLTFEKINC